MGETEMRALSPVLSVITAATLMLPTTGAHAGTILKVGGTLSRANEVPPTASSGDDLVLVVLNRTTQTIEIRGSFSNLTTIATAAHIHCCAPLGKNVGVATTTPAFAGFPLGATSGSFDLTFSLRNPSFYNPAFVVAIDGTIEGAEKALEAGIEAGLSYFDIHTTKFPGGEIRSQLLAVP